MPRPDSSARAVALLLLLAACGDATSTVTAPLAAPEPAVALMANATGAPAFDDAFDLLDGARWEPRAHPLGRGEFRFENVVAADGAVRLVHPAGTLDGGEMRTRVRYGYGRYEAAIRTPFAPGTISAFFLYQDAATNDELDIEIFNDGSRRVMFTVWVADRQKYGVTKTLPFDPSAGTHRYRIEWEAGRVQFFVDDVLMQSWSHKKNVPAKPMYLMANAWWPVWIGGAPHATDHAMVIDRVVAVPR